VNKKLCKIKEEKKIKQDKKSEFECKNCGGLSAREKQLCKPKKIK